MLKKLYWDLSWRQGRYEYLHWFCRGVPGQFGIIVRRFVLRRFFGSAAESLEIYPGVHIRGIHKLRIGKNVCLGPNTMVNANGGVDIGDNVLIGPAVKIWSVNHAYHDLTKTIAEQGFVDKHVTINEGCWLGTGVIVLPGANIGRRTIVAAGSVVTGRRYPENIILAGNPARTISTRTASYDQ